MSPIDGWHPSRADVLLASEGELPPRKLERIQRHLDRCADCQGYLRHTDAVIGAYRARVQAVDGDSQRTSVDRHQFQARLLEDARSAQQQRQRLPPRLWLRIAAVVPLVLALVFSTRFIPTLRANELLDRAAAGERDAAVDADVRIVRGRGAPAVWETVLGETLVRDIETPGGGTAPVGRLSIAGFRDWRRGLRSKTDRVFDVDQDTVVETRASEGAIRQGTLVLRGRPLRAWRLEWILADDTRVEITRRETSADASGLIEASGTATGSAAVAPASATSTSLRTGAATTEPTRRVDGRALAHLEVQVHARLHGLGAGLANRLAVEATPAGRVRVSGVLDEAKEKRALVEALSGLEPLEWQVQAADELPVSAPPPESAHVIRQAEAQPALLADWLARTFEAPQARRQFGATAFAHVRDARASALALRRLAERYPLSAVTSLAQDDREMIRTLLERHRRDVQTALLALADHLTPLSSLDARQQAAATPAADAIGRESVASDSSTRVQDPAATGAELVTSLRRVEQQLLRLLSDVAHADTASPSDADAALDVMRADLQRARMLSALRIEFTPRPSARP